MTAFDDFLDLEEWLATLRKLGIDTAEQFATETDLIAKVSTIDRAMREYRDATTTNYNTHARRIADGDLDAAGIIAAANTAATETKPDHHERVAEVLERSLEFAQAKAARQFARRGATILDVIRAKFDELGARIVAASGVIPVGVLNLEDATRLGHADVYLQLERDLAVWGDMSVLIGAWTSAGMLDDRRDRYSVEYMVTDPEAFREAGAGSSKPIRRAASIAAGRPNLHIPAGPALAPSEDRRAQQANYDANRADEAAREDLGLPARR